MNDWVRAIPVYGEKKLEPIKYSIREEIVGWWPFKKKQFYLVTEFGSLGPIQTREEAQMMLDRCIAV